MTKRAVTYARVSYDDSGTDGRNLDSQQEMCRDYCAKRGYVVTREIREDDRGASGAEFDLPGITEVLELAQARAFDVLVVREGDRMSRDRIKAAILRRDLNKCGVAIEYVLYDFPPGPAGDLARNVMDAVAEYGRQDAIIKTTRGRRNSIKSGNVNVCARPPYGYAVLEKDETHPNRRLVPYEPEAKIVRMIFDLYINGENGEPMTMDGITRRLIQMQVPRPSDTQPAKGPNSKRGACEWNRCVAQHILKNETYIGRWYYGKATNQKWQENGKTRYKTIHNPKEHWLAISVPALVDCETWERAQAQLDLNRRNVWRRPENKYLLRRLLTCGKCGVATVCNSSQGHGKGPYLYYACAAHMSPLKFGHACDQKRFRADWVDAEVWGWIKELLTHPKKLEKALKEVEAENEREAAPTRRRLDTVSELLAEREADKARLMDLYLGKLYTLEEIAEKKTRLEETIGGLKTQQAKLQGKLEQQIRSSDQVRKVLDFAKSLGPNVERATTDFEVRRGLMEDLEVTAELNYEEGVPVVYASSVFGKEVFRQQATTIRSGRAAAGCLHTTRRAR